MGIKINVQACTCNWGDLIWVFHGSCFPRDFYIFHFLSSLWFAGVCRSFYEVCSVHNYSDDQTNLFSSVVSCIHCMVHGYSLYHTWDLYDLNHTAEWVPRNTKFPFFITSRCQDVCQLFRRQERKELWLYKTTLCTSKRVEGKHAVMSWYMQIKVLFLSSNRSQVGTIGGFPYLQD